MERICLGGLIPGVKPRSPVLGGCLGKRMGTRYASVSMSGLILSKSVSQSVG